MYLVELKQLRVWHRQHTIKCLLLLLYLSSKVKYLYKLKNFKSTAVFSPEKFIYETVPLCIKRPADRYKKAIQTAFVCRLSFTPWKIFRPFTVPNTFSWNCPLIFHFSFFPSIFFWLLVLHALCFRSSHHFNLPQPGITMKCNWATWFEDKNKNK